MSETDVENRISALEREVENLKLKVQPSRDSLPWWEQIAGRFKGDRLYEAAMQNGRAYRNGDGNTESEVPAPDSQEPS
ncbi:MAG: hypothetical protein O3B68_06855 [Planctomycetota bacterium]|nr:hypothetical protein [Planctomycetota bacterium]